MHDKGVWLSFHISWLGIVKNKIHIYKSTFYHIPHKPAFMHKSNPAPKPFQFFKNNFALC